MCENVGYTVNNRLLLACMQPKDGCKAYCGSMMYSSKLGVFHCAFYVIARDIDTALQMARLIFTPVNNGTMTFNFLHYYSEMYVKETPHGL